jgi:acyl-CoA synthetase (AMP-forming)/AMP-acid ligase II
MTVVIVRCDLLQVTAIQIVPPIAVLLAKHPLALEYDLSSVKAAVSGAAPLSRETQDEVLKRTGIDIMQGERSLRNAPILPVTCPFPILCDSKQNLCFYEILWFSVIRTFVN